MDRNKRLCLNKVDGKDLLQKVVITYVHTGVHVHIDTKFKHKMYVVFVLYINAYIYACIYYILTYKYMYMTIPRHGG